MKPLWLGRRSGGGGGEGCVFCTFSARLWYSTGNNRDRILHSVSVCRSRRVRLPDSVGAAGLFLPAGQRSSQHGVARQLQVSKHSPAGLKASPKSIVEPELLVCTYQCCGSVTFWYGSGSGSSDPYIWLTDAKNIRIIRIRNTGTFTSFFTDKKS